MHFVNLPDLYWQQRANCMMKRSRTSIAKLNDLEFEKKVEISKRQASLAALTAATAAHLCKDGPSMLPGLQNGMKAMYANRRPAA